MPQKNALLAGLVKDFYIMNLTNHITHDSWVSIAQL